MLQDKKAGCRFAREGGDSVSSRDPYGQVRPGYLVLSAILLLVGVAITIVQYKVPSILEPVMGLYEMTPSTGAWLMSVFTAVGIFLGQSLFSWDWPLKTSPDIVTAAK